MEKDISKSEDKVTHWVNIISKIFKTLALLAWLIVAIFLVYAFLNR